MPCARGEYFVERREVVRDGHAYGSWTTFDVWRVESSDRSGQGSALLMASFPARAHAAQWIRWRKHEQVRKRAARVAP
jgi:hypothetical protein